MTTRREGSTCAAHLLPNKERVELTQYRPCSPRGALTTLVLAHHTCSCVHVHVHVHIHVHVHVPAIIIQWRELLVYNFLVVWLLWLYNYCTGGQSFVIG